MKRSGAHGGIPLRRSLPLLLPLALWLGGCGTPGGLAPVGRADEAERAMGRQVVARERSRTPAQRVVRRGDTLYGIAWRYGLDYRRLAAWNGIDPPYTIYPGQKIRLTPSDRSTHVSRAAPTRRKYIPEKTRDAASARATESAGRTKERALGTGAVEDRALEDRVVDGWRWPTQGEVITTFSQSGQKGVDIAGRPGQPIYAAADGRVVYSGGGLRGYGELIIIKHNHRYLSAYAHNNKLLVREGDEVTGGQHIAEMGRTGTDRVKLHFEIRRDGKPVDPLAHLPR